MSDWKNLLVPTVCDSVSSSTRQTELQHQWDGGPIPRNRKKIKTSGKERYISFSSRISATHNPSCTTLDPASSLGCTLMHDRRGNALNTKCLQEQPTCVPLFPLFLTFYSCASFSFHDIFLAFPPSPCALQTLI